MTKTPVEQRSWTSRSLTVAGVGMLTLVWLAMLVSGTGQLDRLLLDALYSANRPAVRDVAQAVTVLGGWHALVAFSVAGALWLIYQRRIRPAFLLLAITFIGRTLVELQKAGVGRQRPDLEHLASVKSLSFPSGHAGNSMILLLSIAVIAVPERHRRWSVPLALFGSICVGITRPMLGVHWPSDVVGGWAFGAAWVLVMVALAERWPARRTAVDRSAS
jgi:undecaprenyl-diphosphatase